MKEEKLPKIESLERKYRKHEISFSAIQGNNSPDYLDKYLFEHGMCEQKDIIDKMVEEIDKRVYFRGLVKLPEDDRYIFEKYLMGVKQNDIAEELGISPSAINQRLEKIIYNYRIIMCNDEKFTQTSKWDLFQDDAEYLFNVMLNEIRRTKKFRFDLKEIKSLIKETRKIIRHSISTKANVNIKQQLSKQIDYSKIDDKYIEQMNKSFAEQGVEAHFEDLKHFKGNVMQVLKMVDDFIKDLEKKLEKEKKIQESSK